jgi:hypothetical protein
MKAEDLMALGKLDVAKIREGNQPYRARRLCRFEVAKLSSRLAQPHVKCEC